MALTRRRPPRVARAIRNSRQLSEISFPGNSKSPFRPHNQSFSRSKLSRAAFARSRSGAKIASNRPSANASEIVFTEIRKLCAQFLGVIPARICAPHPGSTERNTSERPSLKTASAKLKTSVRTGSTGIPVSRESAQTHQEGKCWTALRSRFCFRITSRRPSASASE